MIRGTKRPLEKKLDLRASIHNRFDVEVIDAFTGKVKQKARAFNVICDALWTRLFHTSSSAWYPQAYFSYILFGSGSGTPSASDTALFTRLGAKSVSSSMTKAVETGVISRQGFITLNADEYVGSTLTEVGIGYDSTHIVTHALLEDMNGNPISIEKSDTDVIKIYATIYVHFSAGGWYGGSVSMAPFAEDGDIFFAVLTGVISSSRQYYFRLVGAGTRTGSITSHSVEGTTSINASAKKITWASRVQAENLNLPIRSLRVEYGYYSGSWFTRVRFWLTPGTWAPMMEIKAEPCGTGDGSATGFSTAFPVKTGGNVYVDGVQVSGVSVRPGPADGTTLAWWMNRVAARSAAGTPVYHNDNYSYYSGMGILITDVTIGGHSTALENPFYAQGIAKVRFYELDRSGAVAGVSASDDMVTWTSAGTVVLSYQRWVELSIPAALKTKRFWRIDNAGSLSIRPEVNFVADVADTAHNIVFTTPPAAGAVITCDYVPDCIPKDKNHVFDLTLELSFGEYSEA